MNETQSGHVAGGLDLALVVVTHNHHDILRSCLCSIFAAMEGIDGEVIVVDNASTDATSVVMTREFPQVRYLHNPVNVHYTRAVNQGMRATGGRYVMLLNDDTVLDQNSLRTLLRFMGGHPKCGAVGPALVSAQGEVQGSAKRFPTPFREMMMVSGLAWWLWDRRWADEMQTQYRSPLKERMVDWVCGGAILFRRSVIEQLNYHDEQYLFYRDDPDIGMRLKTTGWDVWYCPDSRVVHYHGMSTVKTPNKARFDVIETRSRRHYHRKFSGIAGLVFVEVCIGGAVSLRALKAAVCGKWKKAGENWRQILVLLTACVKPREESEAELGFLNAQYNGVNGAMSGSANGVGECVGQEGVKA